METIRPPAVAGSFYPAEPARLRATLKKFFTAAQLIPATGRLRALIVPHAGYEFSGKTAAWGFAQLPKLEGQHLVLLGPSHYASFAGLVASASNFWETPLGKVKHLVPPPVSGLVALDDGPHNPEHCLEVELPFLQYHLRDFSISAFLTSDKFNWDAAVDYFYKVYPSSFFIFSSDLSHYLPQEIARRKDRDTIKAILTSDSDYFLSRENAACGSAGILLLLKLAKPRKWKGKLLYYDTSATASGDTSAVVGYAAVGFYA